MTTKETGGPAFPSANDVWVGNVGTQGHPGMTLRDWFAGQALAGLAHFSSNTRGGRDYIATAAYECADAMLKARGE